MKPARGKIISLKKKKSSIVLKWKYQSKASGYEIYMSGKKKSGFIKIKTIKNARKCSYMKNKINKKKKYYFKVRAYKTVSKKKIYGKFSDVKGWQA